MGHAGFCSIVNMPVRGAHYYH